MMTTRNPLRMVALLAGLALAVSGCSVLIPDPWAEGAPATAGPAPAPEPAIGPLETVVAYERAWAEGDCEGYLALTTEEYRALRTGDCAAFEAQVIRLDELLESKRSTPPILIDDRESIGTFQSIYPGVAAFSPETVIVSIDHVFRLHAGDEISERLFYVLEPVDDVWVIIAEMATD